MSKEGRWTIGFGAGTLILTAIGTWMAVMHENEHQEGIAAVVITILAGASLLALNGYSIHRNLRDARRCKNIQRNIDVAKTKFLELATERKYAVGQARLLSHFSRRADDLAGMLETLWHHFNNAGEKLIHPIAARIEMKDWVGDHATTILNERLSDFIHSPSAIARN